MDTVDYIYRFDPRQPSDKTPPQGAEEARQRLEDGNRVFSRWMARCQNASLDGDSKGDVVEMSYVVECNALEVGKVHKQHQLPKQAPFAVVVGCSDARVPLEMLFGQGFNNMFVVRVAGNVMGEVCLGSVDFALGALSESLKVVVVLGHSGCGAVSAAVDSYLEPAKFWSKSISRSLKVIQERIFVAVREAANGLQEVWGPDAAGMPGYRSALIESAVALNAAQSAFDLREEADRSGNPQIEVFFGVLNLYNHQVCMPVVPDAPVADENVRLASAPSHPEEFLKLAVLMAQILKPMPA